jgi:hypothetical protein
MRSASLLAILFVFNSIYAFADVCRDGVTAHPDMVRCMRDYLSESQESIERLIKEKGSIYEIPEGYYESQRGSIHERCMIYAGLGGQRSEIFEIQCEVDEAKRLFDLVDSYIRASDAN